MLQDEQNSVVAFLPPGSNGILQLLQQDDTSLRRGLNTALKASLLIWSD
jgi:hypothetical protein